jgi:YbbR domain-containing protein
VNARVSKAARVTKRTLTQNLGLKALSLVAALALFSIVRGEQNAQKSVFVDVRARRPPASSERMLLSEVPKQVKVTLRGTRSVLNSIKSGDIPPVTVDLRDTSRNYYYFEPEAFDVPAGVQDVDPAPRAIALRWGERTEQRVPVEVRLDGMPSEDLQARLARVEPATVTVRGPKSEVDPLETVRTVRIDVSGFGKGRHEKVVGLEPPPPHCAVEPDEVTVELEVTARQAERALEGLDVVAMGAQRASVRPAVVDVTVWGSSGVLDKVRREQIVPTVDVSRVDPQAAAQEAQVELRGVPAGVEAQIVPPTVLVTVEAPPQEPADQK